MEKRDLFDGYGVEIELPSDEDFLKVRETLTRIGVESPKSKTLFQSCHILHKKGRYAIMHFKELFLMDGKHSDLCDNDLHRRNTIVNLLREWKLVKVCDADDFAGEDRAPMSQIKIIPFRDKDDWTLEAKYNIGKRY